MDLLNLSRPSKEFRKTILGRSTYAEQVWKRARKNTGLPDPPAELSEPKYAALVFQRLCCNIVRLQKSAHRNVLIY